MGGFFVCGHRVIIGSLLRGVSEAMLSWLSECFAAIFLAADPISLMPTPAVSLRLKRFRHRFGISAPRVVVRSVLPRQWVLFFSFLAAAVFAVVIWVFHFGGFLGDSQLADLKEQLRAQQGELALLRSSVGTGQNAVNMERAAQQQLVARIQELEAENSALKEDMLIFERLIPVAGQESLVRIESFRVLSEASTRYRYRLLLAYQAAQRGGGFRGVYEVVAAYRLPDGALRQLVLPGRKDGVVEVQHFLRREGVIELPAGATLISVEARLLQAGKLVTKQVANL